MIWYDNGSGSTTPAGYPTIGLWFDFSKLDPATGLPTAGQIANMFVNGAASLRGPQDNGTMVWCDGSQDRIGNFPAQNLFADFGEPIQTQVMGKADFMADVWGDQAPISVKQLDNVRLLISITNSASGETLSFQVSSVFDFFGYYASYANTAAVEGFGSGAIVGTAIVGTAVLGLPANAAQYQVVKAYTQAPGQGKIIQIGFTESSVYSWTCLGYVLTVNMQNVGGISDP